MSAAEIARKQIIKEMAAWLQDTVRVRASLWNRTHWCSEDNGMVEAHPGSRGPGDGYATS